MSKKAIWALIIVLIVLVGVGVTLAVALRTGGPYVGTVLEAETNTPLANVSVSDGRNVVKTDADGNFSLPGYRKTRFITVTTPAGYETEQYYISASRDTARYDFTLRKSDIPAGAAHSFLQISDTEIGEGGVGAWIEHVKSLVQTENPAFLIHTGDICYEAGLKRHLSDMNTENMGVPVRYVIGNHDYVDGKYGEELFESIYGPVWYSFEVGNVHYVVTPFQTGADEKSGYNKNDRWRWLENDLANTDPDMKVVIFNHTLPPEADYTISFDRKTLDLKQHNLLAWVFGHYHYNYVQNNDGVFNISTARPDCGGIDQSPSGTRQISIAADGSLTSEMFYYDLQASAATLPESVRFAATLPGKVQFCDTLTQGDWVYTATVDDGWPRDCGIYCLNATDGSVQWTAKTINSVKNNLVLAGDKLYAQDCEGNVYCLRAADGSVLWQKKVAMSTGLSTSTGICLDGDLLYVGCAAAVTALQAETGETVWENVRGKGEGSAAEFIVTGDKLIVSSHWDALLALDKNTGKELWANRDGSIRFRSSTPIVVDENTLLVADDNAIMLVDSATGDMRSKTAQTDYNFASSAQPVVADGVAYMATANKGVLAVRLEDQSILWQCAVGEAKVYTAPYVGRGAATVESTPVLEDGKLWFGASDGNVYCLNAADGAILQTISLGVPIFGKLSLTPQAIYVTDFSGRVICLARA